jgi:hypothetical protein
MSIIATVYKPTALLCRTSERSGRKRAVRTGTPTSCEDFSDLDARLAIGPPKVVRCGYVTRTRFRIEMTSIGPRCLRKNNGVMLLLHAGENFADYVTNLWSIEPSSTLLEHIVHPP